VDNGLVDLRFEEEEGGGGASGHDNLTDMLASSNYKSHLPLNEIFIYRAILFFKW